jgi:predicted RNA binding protein YcfA (HicA-like mRNA interferase family)
MPDVPLLKPREVVKAFRKQGHIATLSISDHPEVARGTLRAIIARAGLTIEDFLAALGR